MCSLGSVWYITHGCGSYPALPYPSKRPFQLYTVLGTRVIKFLSISYHGYKLEIGPDKTKVMTNNPNGFQREIKIKGQRLEEV